MNLGLIRRMQVLGKTLAYVNDVKIPKTRIQGPQPDCLKDLNEIEKGAIRLIIPYVTMFKNKAGSRGYSGHSISFYQDITSFAQTLPTSLPRPIEDLQIISIKTSKTRGDKKEFKASGSKIRVALEWLIAHCEDYKDIKINEANLAQHPTDSNIELPSVDDAEDENDKNSITAKQTNN